MNLHVIHRVKSTNPIKKVSFKRYLKGEGVKAEIAKFYFFYPLMAAVGGFCVTFQDQKLSVLQPTSNLPHSMFIYFVFRRLLRRQLCFLSWTYRKIGLWPGLLALEHRNSR